MTFSIKKQIKFKNLLQFNNKIKLHSNDAQYIILISYQLHKYIFNFIELNHSDYNYLSNILPIIK